MIPWVARLFVIEHYRGKDFAVPLPVPLPVPRGGTAGESGEGDGSLAGGGGGEGGGEGGGGSGVRRVKGGFMTLCGGGCTEGEGVSEGMTEEEKAEEEAECWATFHRWRAHVMALPAVRATLADEEALLETYQRYANGTAASKVAEAVRRGKSAHEHD